MEDARRIMDAFLQSVERRAFQMARFATSSEDDALDVVQEAMMMLVQRYSDKPEEEWRPLFFTVLQNKIRDFHRRKNVRQRWTALLPWGKTENEAKEDPVQQLADPSGLNPEKHMEQLDSAKAVNAAIELLPLRQQQAFLLRAWEGMSVAETAQAMECSEGSVKTHYSRAVASLREQLGDYES